MPNNADPNFAKAMIDNWNKFLVDNEVSEEINRRLLARYGGAPKATNKVLWIPTDEVFYSQTVVEIAAIMGRRYPYGDYYLPGDNTRAFQLEYINPDLQTRFDEAIILYLSSPLASEESMISLIDRITNQMNKWRLPLNGLTGLQDLLALRFMPVSLFNKKPELFTGYIGLLASSIHQVAKYEPSADFANIRAYLKVIKCLFETLVFDLIKNDAQSPSIINTVFRKKQTAEIKNSWEKMTSALAAVADNLHHLRTPLDNPQRNSVRLLDPYYALFSYFISDNDKKTKRLGYVDRLLASHDNLCRTAQDTDIDKFLVPLPKEVIAKQEKEKLEQQEINHDYPTIDTSANSPNLPILTHSLYSVKRITTHRNSLEEAITHITSSFNLSINATNDNTPANDDKTPA